MSQDPLLTVMYGSVRYGFDRYGSGTWQQSYCGYQFAGGENHLEM